MADSTLWQNSKGEIIQCSDGKLIMYGTECQCSPAEYCPGIIFHQPEDDTTNCEIDYYLTTFKIVRSKKDDDKYLKLYIPGAYNAWEDVTEEAKENKLEPGKRIFLTLEDNLEAYCSDVVDNVVCPYGLLREPEGDYTIHDLVMGAVFELLHMEWFVPYKMAQTESLIEGSYEGGVWTYRDGSLIGQLTVERTLTWTYNPATNYIMSSNEPYDTTLSSELCDDVNRDTVGTNAIDYWFNIQAYATEYPADDPTETDTNPFSEILAPIPTTCDKIAASVERFPKIKLTINEAAPSAVIDDSCNATDVIMTCFDHASTSNTTKRDLPITFVPGAFGQYDRVVGITTEQNYSNEDSTTTECGEEIRRKVKDSYDTDLVFGKTISNTLLSYSSSGKKVSAEYKTKPLTDTEDDPSDTTKDGHFTMRLVEIEQPEEPNK